MFSEYKVGCFEMILRVLFTAACLSDSVFGFHFAAADAGRRVAFGIEILEF